MGFDILGSSDTEDITVIRQEVVTKDEFKGRIVDSGVDTGYYGGVVWSRLQYLFHGCGSTAVADLELPIHFIAGTMSSHLPRVPNLLVADCIVPTADALARSIDNIPRYFGVNPRLIRTLRSVAP